METQWPNAHFGDNLFADAVINFECDDQDKKSPDFFSSLVLGTAVKNPWHTPNGAPAVLHPGIFLEAYQQGTLTMGVIYNREKNHWQVSFHPAELLRESQIYAFHRYVTQLVKSLAEMDLKGVRQVSGKVEYRVWIPGQMTQWYVSHVKKHRGPGDF
ncbi:MAG: hypothetical protein Q7S52_01130 [bacterium]|nr:hypothetical protein [bacterium]